MSEAEQQCIFCAIVAGNVPCEKIFEDDHVFVFLDIHPINRGHALVIPKAHYENIFTTPVDIFQQIMKTAHHLSPHIKKVSLADGINIGMNNGLAAGQLVFHAHVHVIPRFVNDGHKHWSAISYAEGEMATLGEQIRTDLRCE